MTPRAKTLLIALFVAGPALAYTAPCFGHNGRDADPPDFDDRASGSSHRVVDIFSGISVSTDPRTGVRTYTQTGDVPANPARAIATASTAPMEHGVDFWVEQSFRAPAPSGGGDYYAPEPSGGEVAYSDGYSDYGYGYGYGYLPLGGYGYGGRPGRPGHGHGGSGGGGRPGRPGRPGHGGGGEPPRNSGYNLPPRTWSPPPGPLGGGVGSPPPYQFDGVGAPPPVLRHNTIGGRRR